LPCSLPPALHANECIQLLLLVPLEALFLLLLVSRKFFLVSALLQFQPITLLCLMGAEVCPVLLPPRLVEIVLIEFRRLFLLL
jgi:hypothetical protein